VNLQTNAYQCFKCGSAGNQLDLYAAVTKKSLYRAALDLCEKLNSPTPWGPALVDGHNAETSPSVVLHMP
jgi:hypothetical protein